MCVGPSATAAGNKPRATPRAKREVPDAHFEQRRRSFAAALVAAAAESVRQHGVFKQPQHRRESTVVVVPPPPEKEEKEEKEERALEAWQLEGWTLVDHQSEQAEIAA